MQIAILGRQPKLSLAEIEALYGATSITPLGDYAALVNSETPLPQVRLGGTLKSAKLLTRLEKTDLVGAFTYLQSSVVEHLQYVPEGKLQLGVSVYGFEAQRDWLLKQTLTLKKVIKGAGQSVRIIENKSPALETAQVLYNKLTGPLGWELLVIKDGDDVVLGQTYDIQNINAYSERDFGRPKRDTYVGMLPPKLAQIMINLVSPQTLDNKPTLLDPFCGTGVVLQEASLMGYTVTGSDLSEKMVEYSKTNLAWLPSITEPLGTVDQIVQADATQYTWPNASNFKVVVGESYLGKPLTTVPKPQQLQLIMDEANTVAYGFLKNIHSQLRSGTHLCLALPAWYLGKDQFQHLPMLDQLRDLGYNRLDFVHAIRSDLIYHRTDQIVARELTILEKV